MMLNLLRVSALAATVFATAKSPFTLLPSTSYGENVDGTSIAVSSSFTASLNIFAPQNVNLQKAFPIILFFPGLGSNIPSSLYGNVLSETASKGNGAVIVAWDGLGVSNPLDLAGQVGHATSILTWCTNGGLQAYVKSNFKTQFTVNTTAIFFSAHSSGNQIAVSLGIANPSSLGLILLDPVDSDPFHFTTPVITNTVVYKKPVLVIASGLGMDRGISWISFFPPCCPVGYSSQHFYDAFTTAPKFFSNATLYGHADLISPDADAASADSVYFCAGVANSAVNSYESYRNFITGQSAAFIAMYSGLRDCTYSQYLTTPSTFPIAATYKYTQNTAATLC